MRRLCTQALYIQIRAAACAIFKHLTGDNLPRDRCKGRDNARVMAEMALATRDYDILQDLRELNGRPKNAAFDVFWGEMKSLLESHACVDDRRHGKSNHYA